MTSPYLNVLEVAEYLRFTDASGAINRKAARQWIIRHVAEDQRVKRGAAVLVTRDGVDAALRRQR